MKQDLQAMPLNCCCLVSLALTDANCTALPERPSRWPRPVLLPQARDLLCDAWAQARRPGRAEAACMRAAAYLHAGNAQQAARDLRLALVYGPQLDNPPASSAQQPNAASNSSNSGSSAVVKRPGGAGKREPEAEPPEPPPPPAMEAAGRSSAWPAALGLFSAALEALADNIPAALAAQRVGCDRGWYPCLYAAGRRLGGLHSHPQWLPVPARLLAPICAPLFPSLSVQAHQLDPAIGEYAEAVERLQRRIPEPCAAALRVRQAEAACGGAGQEPGQLPSEPTPGAQGVSGLARMLPCLPPCAPARRSPPADMHAAGAMFACTAGGRRRRPGGAPGCGARGRAARVQAPPAQVLLLLRVDEEAHLRAGEGARGQGSQGC